ncbi:MAG: SH3 domain-containing protein [Candidatus Riflebacteria bacterium]|nr:SH3 domain-containing protein [Candidatus Riflebacteria bacterium]
MKRLMNHFSKLFLVALLLSVAFPVVAKNYVIPTWYGYGVIANTNDWVRPYIVSNPSAAPWTYSYNWLSPNAYAPIPAAYSPQPTYANNAGSWHLGFVNCEALNVRSSPEVGNGNDHDSNVIGAMGYGERVWVYGKKGDWYYVQSASGRPLVGYVHSDYIKLANYPTNGGYTYNNFYPYNYSSYPYYGNYGYMR